MYAIKLFLAFSLVLLLAQSANAATINLADCAYATVNTAVNTTAAVGDTVTCPNGSWTWNNTLTTTKGVNLIGGQGGTTTITYGSIGGGSEQFLIQHNPSDWTLNTPFRISGFTFDLNSTGPGIGLGVNNKTPPFVIQDQVRIDHNTFANIGTKFAIWNYCNFYGVVDHNTFTGSSVYPFKNDTQGTEFGFHANSPQNIFVSGSSNYIYYEDNTITLSGGDNIVGENQYSGRSVFRYNTITGAASSSLFEFHGHQTSGAMGASFGGEIYGNRITNSGDNLVKIRGGRSFVFLNSIVGTVNNAAYTSLVTCPDSYASEMMIHDTYWFGSRANYTGSLTGTDVSGTLSCNSLTNIPTLGRDIISDNSTPGVTCGTLANIPGTCTVGQGYWATTQSCSDLTGMVGIEPATPITGTLYKCTSTNTWTSFYTPYTYPHPLASELVNGTCGTADGGYYASAPTLNLCATGTATAVTGSYAWACGGSGGGTSEDCTAGTISVSADKTAGRYTTTQTVTLTGNADHFLYYYGNSSTGTPATTYTVPIATILMNYDGTQKYLRIQAVDVEDNGGAITTIGPLKKQRRK